MIEDKILSAVCERAAHNSYVALISARLKHEQEEKARRLEMLAQAYPVGTTDLKEGELGKLLLFTPRWTKMRACVDFAFAHPTVRLAAEVGRTPTQWVFAAE